jgi:hypothetical protein
VNDCRQAILDMWLMTNRQCFVVRLCIYSISRYVSYLCSTDCFQLKPKSPFHSLVEAEIVSINKEPKTMQWPEQDSQQSDEDVLLSGPEVKQHPRSVTEKIFFCRQFEF